MCRKTIFLDIDGTLMNFWGQLPESAEIALKKKRDIGLYCVQAVQNRKYIRNC